MKYNFTQAFKPLLLIVTALFCARVQAQTISTFAGGYGDGMSATTYGVLSQPSSILVVPAGLFSNQFTEDIKKLHEVSRLLMGQI